MKSVWQIFAVILLTLIGPASMCCLVPQQAENQRCCGCATHEEDHDAPVSPDACPSATLAHSQVPAPVMLPAMEMIELASIIHEMMRLNELLVVKESPAPLMTTAPPQLRTTWVFVSRAALPARAPAELA
jgi:hypothetical protein